MLPMPLWLKCIYRPKETVCFNRYHFENSASPDGRIKRHDGTPERCGSTHAGTN